MEAGVLGRSRLEASFDCGVVDGERVATRESSREFCVVKTVVRLGCSRLLVDEGRGDLLCC